jgi:dCMP deaminase
MATGHTNPEEKPVASEAESHKRLNVLKWEDYFMAIASLSAERSKDPEIQVGACIVNKHKRIVGIGYNGMPDGIKDEKLPWGNTDKDDMKRKGMFVCHAEMNAILNKNSADVRDCTIYTTRYPCNECAKLIIQSGISKVVYLSSPDGCKKSKYEASEKLLDLARIETSELEREKTIQIIEL